MRILFFLLTVCVCFSCGDDQNDKDRKLIEDYLLENNLEAEVTSEGLYYIIDEPGTSEMPNINNTVEAHYRGYYIDEFLFDESGQNPATFPLSNVIQGWQIGIPLFGKGGKGKLLIPSVLGYGSNPPSPTIRKDAILIFDIELVNFY